MLSLGLVLTLVGLPAVATAQADVTAITQQIVKLGGKATGTPVTHVDLGAARAAGFADVEVLAVEHDFFRFYRLVPG